MQKESPHLVEFQRKLSNNLHELQELHKWYCATLDRVRDFIKNDRYTYAVAFGHKHRPFLFTVSVKLMSGWMVNYYHRLCAEKLVLETHMEEINQTLYN
jgi:hypothetical protein